MEQIPTSKCTRRTISRKDQLSASYCIDSEGGFGLEVLREMAKHIVLILTFYTTTGFIIPYQSPVYKCTRFL